MKKWFLVNQWTVAQEAFLPTLDCQVAIETMDPATVAALLVLICQKRRENVMIQFLILKN